MSTRTCDACGARNPADAPWCTQCFTSFAAPAAALTVEPAPAPTADPAPVDGADGAEPSDEDTGAVGGGSQEAQQRDIRQTASGEVEWRCARCEAWSPLQAGACVACGSARRGFGPDPDEPAETLDEDRLVAASILLPGLGHVRAGRVGSGVARALFALGWLVGGLLLLLAAVRAGAAYLAALPLLAGAVVVWVLTVLDVRSLARGERTERLDGRALLWLMAGVTGALVLVLMVDTWRLAG